ncbi:MAG: pyridoxal-phosphate dependent enzyme [Parvibaculaceae bacterium]
MSSLTSPTVLTLNANLDLALMRALQPSRADIASAEATIAAWNGYAPTPLAQPPALAAFCNVAAVALKLESARFDIGSFKAVGPPYALQRAIERRLGDARRAEAVAVAATSGNHGRALAWGAKRLGARCHIVMPAHISPGREAAIVALGAEVTRVRGNFDDALAEAATISTRPGHMLIADLDDAASAAVARDTLSGYSALAGEIVAQTADAPPTHVFIAAGNGSLAAAICHRLANDLTPVPKSISVEPCTSDAVRRSLAAGKITAAPGNASVMDGLVTRAPSAIAWPMLRHGLAAGLAISDDWAVDILRALATGAFGDPAVEMGETGVAAVAGLIAAARDPGRRAELGIDAASRLMAIVCEGVTDRAVFDNLIGDARTRQPAVPTNNETMGNMT